MGMRGRAGGRFGQKGFLRGSSMLLNVLAGGQVNIAAELISGVAETEKETRENHLHGGKEGGRAPEPLLFLTTTVGQGEEGNSWHGKAQQKSMAWQLHARCLPLYPLLGKRKDRKEETLSVSHRSPVLPC